MNPFSQSEKHFPFIFERHRGRRLFCWNAFFWGLGNGLVSTSLVIYIIRSLAANSMDKAQIGIAISWIIAAPRLIGLLRILTPCLIDWVGNRRRVCFGGYLLSPLVLLLLPISVPILSRWSVHYINETLWIIGLIWAIYHLIEYFASITLWSWIADLVSARIRVPFLANRERWMIAGQFLGMLLAGLYSYLRIQSREAALIPFDITQHWKIYLLPAWFGILFLILAAFPILGIPEVALKKVDSLKERLKELLLPFRSRSFLCFVCFGCWIQMANGLTQSPQSIFQMNILNVSMLTALMLGSWTKIGQMCLAHQTGKWFNRWGNRRLIAISLLIVSTGPLFYLFATPEYWFLIIFAATVWIGWIGVNLGISNLSIVLSPAHQRRHFFRSILQQRLLFLEFQRFWAVGSLILLKQFLFPCLY
ncbi:MAG: hypothetical protein Q4C95_04940 [Planctomycetia bacterium]|nr:hypothetical protein [Planctomycetia bacterium]